MSEGVAPGQTAVLGVIEVRDRAGQVVQRWPWTGAPVRIGRAYDNDIIVSDPYVCPHHLEITATGTRPVARDRGSVNGIYRDNGSVRSEMIELGDGASLIFGHSQVRYHEAGSPVPPAWRDTARHGLSAKLGKPWLLAAAALAAVLSLAGRELFDNIGHSGAPEVVAELLYLVIGILAWAGFWSMLNRLLVHRARFAIHLTISLLGVVGLFLGSQATSLIGFALGLDESVWWLKLGTRVLVLLFVIHAHLRFAVPGSARRHLVTAGFASLALFGTPAAGELIDRAGFSSLPYLDPLLRPPAFRLVPGETPERFLERAQSVRSAVDDAASD